RFMADRETELAQASQRRRMRSRQVAALDRADRIRVERERPLGADPRIELAQRAGSAVAWIGEHLAAVLACVRVVLLERRAWHVYLAAHLQHPRPVVAAQAQWHTAHGTQVRGHVLAACAVAARR